MNFVHPLDPLGPDEISRTAQIVRDAYPDDRVTFRVITLQEPPKKTLTAFLALEQAGQSTTPPKRRAMVHALLSKSNAQARYFEIGVDLDSRIVDYEEHLVGRHSYIDAEYMKAVETACLADSKVQKQISDLCLPNGTTVVIEPWAYATDGMNDMSSRITMCWFYLRTCDQPDANYYAYPLDVCAEVSEELKVLRVYRLPSGEHDRVSDTQKLFNHDRIHQTSEYHPDFVKARGSTQPYQIIQPNGPSFTINGYHVSWEKWTFRVGFNYREGMTIHDIKYDDRSLFYRLSLAEMFVPYGDSRNPYQRKGAFDLGNDGAGVNANNLRLGCDCLGHIKYFDGWHTTASGEPLKLPNIICCHEVDDGILWKHTNFRTNHPVVTRSRVLVLQSVVTVTNYEYVFAFHFKQDASIHYEVRATGILSTAPIDIGDKVPFGTIVAPGVLAPYHQHLFSLRIDPALEGHQSSFLVEETIPMPFDKHAPSDSNPFGVGFTKGSRVVDQEGFLDLDHSSDRTFKIVNENNINPVTGTPVGYQLVPHYSRTLLAHPESFHAQRAEFATHAIWITRHRDDELYPAGAFTMQSGGGEGIASWIAKRQKAASKGANGQNGQNGGVSEDTEHDLDSTMVRNRDIVIWHTFGSTHVPRIEDWPVMPCEKMTVTLKPVNFFTGNPGLDVAPATQKDNRSVLVGIKCEKEETTV